MTSPQFPRSYEKHAWAIIFSVWAIHLPLAIRNFVPPWQDICLGCAPNTASPLEVAIGMTWNQLVVALPGVSHFLGATLIDDGISGAGFAILGMIISLTAFKRGEKWSWFATWSLPIGIAVAQINQFALTGSAMVILLTLPFELVSILGLILPYRIFFRSSKFRFENSALPHQGDTTQAVH
jgi:hypothetical protein